MRRLAAVFGLTFLLSTSQSLTAANVPQTFGEKISVEKATSLKEVSVSPASFEGKDLLATGKIVKVCEKKGCWMQVKTDDADVHVTFKDYGFFVPLGSQGKSVRLQGRVSRREVSVAEQRHLLEDAGAKQLEIEAVKTPKQELTFVASGVEIGG